MSKNNPFLPFPKTSSSSSIPFKVNWEEFKNRNNLNDPNRIVPNPFLIQNDFNSTNETRVENSIFTVGLDRYKKKEPNPLIVEDYINKITNSTNPEEKEYFQFKLHQLYHHSPPNNIKKIIRDYVPMYLNSSVLYKLSNNEDIKKMNLIFIEELVSDVRQCRNKLIRTELQNELKKYYSDKNPPRSMLPYLDPNFDPSHPKQMLPNDAATFINKMNILQKRPPKLNPFDTFKKKIDWTQEDLKAKDDEDGITFLGMKYANQDENYDEYFFPNPNNRYQVPIRQEVYNRHLAKTNFMKNVIDLKYSFRELFNIVIREFINYFEDRINHRKITNPFQKNDVSSELSSIEQLQIGNCLYENEFKDRLKEVKSSLEKLCMDAKTLLEKNKNFNIVIK